MIAQLNLCLYLDFYLSTDKYKRHSRVICWEGGFLDDTLFRFTLEHLLALAPPSENEIWLSGGGNVPGLINSGYKINLD